MKLSAMSARALAILLTTLFTAGTARAEDPRLKKLLDDIDNLWRGRSSEAVLTMKVKTENYTRTMKMRGWSKGKEKTLVRILAPLKEKGTATLKSGNNVYTYLPKTDRTMRLTSGMMMGSWMGSHFTNDDLVKESRLLDDYDAAITFEGKRGGEEVLELTLTPKPDAAVVWGKIVMEVGAKDHLPRKAVYYDEDMDVSRTATYADVKEMGGRRLPATMRMVPADKPTEYTEMRYEKLTFDEDIPDSFFSIGRLRQR